VTLDDGQHRGRGEACGVYYLDDNVQQMVAALEARRAAIESGIDRASLQQLLPAGGARNALDCALWELDARRTGKAVWELAGLDPPRPLVTTFTLGADEPAVMADGARSPGSAC
jgi:L-alanine-DL-glutamate epimerase-like enolase superfamily enzyme